MTAPWKKVLLEGIAGDASGSCGAVELALQLARMAHAAAEIAEVILFPGSTNKIRFYGHT